VAQGVGGLLCRRLVARRRRDRLHLVIMLSQRLSLGLDVGGFGLLLAVIRGRPRGRQLLALVFRIGDLIHLFRRQVAFAGRVESATERRVYARLRLVTAPGLRGAIHQRRRGSLVSHRPRRRGSLVFHRSPRSTDKVAHPCASAVARVFKRCPRVATVS